jgi:DNA-binding CsgD family transcriptional regulator/tetratricopeptide (TPR) repeat protein
VALGNGHFVGRADELGVLERLLDELDRGRPGAIELAGEPGIGKTRLMGELAARAEGRGHRVLAGSASEFERDLPFAVFVDALDEYLEALEGAGLASLGDEVQAELADVFPALSQLAVDRRPAPQQERYRAHRAIRSLLEQLAKTQPLLLVLDDLHWADSASIELLGTLLRRPPNSPVLMGMAFRPRHVAERLTAALGRARRSEALHRIELGALSPVEAQAFLGDGVEPADAAILYEESGGNPFYLEQLARSLERRGALAPSGKISMNSIGVPLTVTGALHEELALLPERTHLVLQGAAVAGDPFEPELAAAAAGTSEAIVMDAVDDLLRLDLIRPTDVPRRFRFRHPLVRRAVYDATGGGWRLGAHERCSVALAARGANASARAHHVERSARDGDLGAVAILREAGQEVARLAPASAARWFGAALRLLPQTASSDERLGLLLARAGSLAATGQLVAANTDLVDCFEIATQYARGWCVRVATACAAIEHQLGLEKEAQGHLSAALHDLGDPQSAEAVELMIELAVGALHAGDFTAMRDWGGRAATVATRLTEPALRAAALTVGAWADAMAGDGGQGRRNCEEATQLVDQLSDAELSRRPGTLAHLASAELHLDRFGGASRHAQRALEIGRATGQGELLPFVVAVLGVSLWVQGRPREAGELFEGAVEAARLAGNVQNLAWSLLNRSLAALAAGELDAALATAKESFDLLADTEPGTIPSMAAAALAGALLEAGHAERSVDVLLTRAGGEGLRLLGGAWRVRSLELFTRALLATGRRADAERAVAAAKACADAVGLSSATGMAALASAAIALDGDPLTAAERAIAAADTFTSVCAAFDAARAHEVAGRAFARAGERERAAQELKRAATAYESFGASRYRNRAERELGKLGLRPHRRSRPGTGDGLGLESLTGRELQVARLVVDRRTNVQIAAQLFLSEKTVETHLRNIFHKMDVTTRVDLARAIGARLESSLADPLA